MFTVHYTMSIYSVLAILAVLSLSSISANGSAEISYLKHEVLTGTNSNDVKGLVALQNRFIMLIAWPGDPCIGLVPYTWIICNTDPTPRVTALLLSNVPLIGPLPDFSSMDALETIDMSHNALTGPIPDFLGSFPELELLNLEDNDFRGTIPASLSNNKKLTLKLTGNPNLENSPKSTTETPSSTKSTETPSSTQSTETPTSTYSSSDTKKKKSSKLRVILGIAFSIFFFFSVAVGVLAILHQKRKSAAIAATTSGAVEMKGQEGENMANQMGQQGNANGNEHASSDQHHHV